MVPVSFGYPLDLSHQESQHKPLGDLSMEEIKLQLQQLKKNKQHKDNKAKQLYNAIVDNVINVVEYILEICQDINYDISYNSVKFLTYNDLKKIRGITKEGVEYTNNPDNNTTSMIVVWNLSDYDLLRHSYINEYKRYVPLSDKSNHYTGKDFKNIFNNTKNFSDLEEGTFFRSLFFFFWGIQQSLTNIGLLFKVKDLFNLPYDFEKHKYTKDIISQEEQDLINQISNAPLEVINKFLIAYSQSTPEEKTKAKETIKKILAEYKPEVKLPVKKPRINPSLDQSSSPQNKLFSKKNGNPIASILSPLGYVLGGVTIIVVPLTFTGAFIYFVMPQSVWAKMIDKKILKKLKKLKQVK